jgi:tetratricopeptide (TPR) repeat protein
MKYMVSCFAVLLVLVAAPAQASPALGSCTAVEDLDLAGLDRLGESFTTPPYVALDPLGGLQRLARRSLPLQTDIELSGYQAECLEAITGERLKAVRAGESFSYKLQAPTRTVLIFHVANLVGGEALVSFRGQSLLAKAERLLKEGSRAEASSTYQELLRSGVPPWERAMAHAALGRIEKEEGRLESALAQVSLAVEAYPRLASARAEKAVLEEEVARLLAARREERRTSLIAEISILQEEGRDLEAIPLAEEALELTGQDFGPDSTAAAGLIDVLAALNEAAGQNEEAEALLRRAVAVRQEALGADHPETAEARGRLEAFAQRTIQSSEEEAEATEEIAVSSIPPEQNAEEESTPWLDPEPSETAFTDIDWGALILEPGQLERAISTIPKDTLEIESVGLTEEVLLETSPAVGRAPLKSLLPIEEPSLLEQTDVPAAQPAEAPQEGTEGLPKVELQTEPEPESTASSQEAGLVTVASAPAAGGQMGPQAEEPAVETPTASTDSEAPAEGGAAIISEEGIAAEKLR